MTSNKKLINAIKDYVVIFIGVLIYGLAWQGFIYSHKITTGGLAGIASLISWVADINVSWPYNIINIFLVLIALKVLGWRFCVKTVFSVMSLSFVIPFFSWVFKEPLLANEPFMAVVIGSALCGISLGMVFSVNGSTGGTDIIAAIINKYRRVTIGRALMIIDVLTISASYFIFKDPDKLVFSFAQVLICNLTLDYFLNGYRQSVQFFIISKHYKEISNRILTDIHRGCTLLNAQGAYSEHDMKIVMVIAKKTESTLVFRAVKEVDPHAFITQSIVRGVYGEGFEALQESAVKKEEEAAK